MGFMDEFKKWARLDVDDEDDDDFEEIDEEIITE